MPDAVAPDREHAQAPRRRRRDHAICMRVVGRDDRRAVRRDDALEQDQLGVEVGFLGRVIVQVVAGEIGEAADRDAHAVEAMLVEAVRGRLHREMRDAVLGEAIERARKLDRIGRGQRAVDFLLSA